MPGPTASLSFLGAELLAGVDVERQGGGMSGIGFKLAQTGWATLATLVLVSACTSGSHPQAATEVSSPSPTRSVAPPSHTPPRPTVVKQPHLIPAEGQLPAAGVCASAEGNLATVAINPDTPSPSCSIVQPYQELQVTNTTNAFSQKGMAITVTFADFAPRRLAIGQSTIFARPFGDSFAIGVHGFMVDNQPSAELWLKT